MWIWPVAFLAGAVSQYYSELWTIKWTTMVQARSYPLSRKRMGRHVWRVVLLGWGLITLGAVDVGSVFGGFWVFLVVYLGSCAGSAAATVKEMWRKWNLKVANLEDDD